MQKRKPSYEELLEENRQLRAQVKILKEALEQAQKRIEELERSSKRQAAPFRRPKNKKKPSEEKGSSGRKSGHKGSSRPEPDQVDENKLVALERCPHCGGPVSDLKPIEQIIEDIPPLCFKTLRLVTYSGWCPNCGKRVRSTDPEQVSSATGCAGVHLGRRVLALAAYLKHALGLTYRKISAVIGVFGIKVTPGGLVQAMHRVAAKLALSWVEIWKQIRAGPVTHSDETSWYVGEPNWWLWGFCRPNWTLYVVDESRGSDVLMRTLGDFEGTLVSDCLSPYDTMECKKQKCYAHHLKALSERIEALPEQSAEILKEVRSMLKTALALGDMREEISREKFVAYRDKLETWADRLLENAYTEPGVEKALHRFRAHKEHLFTFLYDAEVPATNNLAERQLRPAVIARKVSCGNKTDRGRRTWQILASIAATCQQQGRSFMDFVAHSMGLNTKIPQLATARG